MQNRPEDPIVRDASHKKVRTFYFRPKDKRPSDLVRCILFLACALCMVYSGVNIISYVSEYLTSRQQSRELRSLYYEEENTVPLAQETSIPSPEPSAPPEITAVPPMTPATGASAEPTPALWLEPIEYPGNPRRLISSRFTKLRRQNSDIIGWINIAGVLDEAVVQRDNEYYLRRDYRGYHNNNGAVFLEETCDLSSRPYTLMLYAHNMKSGAMFGVLRNYENIAYYRHAPFVTFDTIYEEGRYVIFSAATVSLKQGDFGYFSFAKLNSRYVSNRAEMIRLLELRSVFHTDVDVAPSDQLLLLITCVDDDSERRVVAARRLREGETEEALMKIVQKSRKK